MAELLLSSVAERIIHALCSPSAKRIGLHWGVQDEFRSLANTVSTIKGVLMDAEEKQAAGNHAVKRWLGRLEDAMYDADDLLDEISTEALRRDIMTRDKKAKKVRIFFSKSNQLAYFLKMARKIKVIRERLDAFNAAAKDFHLEVRHVETRIRNREWDTTHPFVLTEAVIGREDDKMAVIHRLLDSNVEENISILPIVGIGGLGKTTLAQFVFNDDQIQNHFQLKMWVFVSDTFHVKNIVEKILESATNRKPELAEMSTLVGKLKAEIDGKRYLLVLDDVWNDDYEKWSRLKQLLMGGASGSRILVTTRSEIVARIVRNVESYPLRGLGKDDSWSLFKQMAFERGQEPEENSGIVAIGREILAKCSGVPLVIRTIGGLLRFKRSEAEWLAFKKNKHLKISENDILPILKLSYDHLPSHLKHCFAYCSLYPEDYNIDRSTLIKHWTAQGFVKSFDDQDRCLEDVGDEYFMDLLSRSFFQEVIRDEFGNIIQCKIHGLMHDLAMSVAGSLITTLGSTVYDSERNVDEKTLHASFVGNRVASFPSISTSLYKASRLRTFLCLDDIDSNIDCDEIFSNFKFLRMLDLSARNLDFVPSSIGKLKHLRYLDLSANNVIQKLPDSITRLHNLQTLILSHCSRLKELPRAIRELVNLRHLEIDDCSDLTYMPCGLGQLTNLQTLSTFVVHSGSLSKHTGGLQELNGLNNLRGNLQIKNLGHGKGVASECRAANLKEKQRLHALYLQWSGQGDVNGLDVVEDERSLEGFRPHPNLKQLCLEEYVGSKFPSWLLSLTNLVKFELRMCKNFEYLPPLSQLPYLKYLVLVDMEAMRHIFDDGDSNEFSSSLVPVAFFPSLKEIRLYNCPYLKGWWRRDPYGEVNSASDNSVEIMERPILPSFPCLSTLMISNCPMLTSMPMFPHLEEELVLRNASSKLLQQTMMMNMAAPRSSMSIAVASSSFTPLSKLKHLRLHSIADLETLPLQNLTSLESLMISDCRRLKSLSPGILQYLTALQHLDLDHCLELELANDEDGMQWRGPPSLLSLRFSVLPKLVSLPPWLQHATTLLKLQLSYCENLMAIPEWIHNCNSLQVLEICKCPSLASLPEGMFRLTSLWSLTIKDCPILLQRCEREIGEDWAKVAHIPDLELRYSHQ